jgi:enterochelin esterase-like enzyme
MTDSKKAYFRTTELATVPTTVGQLQMMTVKSPSLKGRGDLTLYVPDQAQGRVDLPVVILLHGVYGSHWAWALKGQAHETLQRLIDEGAIEPMILAMPSDGLWGDGSGYVPHLSQDFEQWIVQDVPEAVHVATGNALAVPHYIAGLSMGGFGALRIGAKYPNRFAAFAGHSSITEVAQMGLFVEEDLSAYVHDVDAQSVLSTILRQRESLRPFRFDCGVDDVLIEHNRKLEQSLREAAIDFSYEEFPGGHEWAYWQTHIERTFKFFAQQSDVIKNL